MMSCITVETWLEKSACFIPEKNQIIKLYLTYIQFFYNLRKIFKI